MKRYTSSATPSLSLYLNNRELLMETIATRSLPQAAYIIANNGRLLQLERDGETCFFLFKNDQSTQALMSEWDYSENPQVNARFYEDARSRLLRLVKTRE